MSRKNSALRLPTLAENLERRLAAEGYSKIRDPQHFKSQIDHLAKLAGKSYRSPNIIGSAFIHAGGPLDIVCFVMPKMRALQFIKVKFNPDRHVLIYPYGGFEMAQMTVEEYLQGMTPQYGQTAASTNGHAAKADAKNASRRLLGRMIRKAFARSPAPPGTRVRPSRVDHRK